MFAVLHSSAGAGKTHALVKHYLVHALRGDDPAAYRRVLALTFTNKAAGEMRERVLEYLEKLAAGGPHEGAMADVAGHLGTQAGIDEAALARRANAVLGHMLHHWGDVAISTIDAFTRRMVRPFARDLQLDAELRMTTEETYYRQRAVEALVAEAGGDPKVTRLLTEACLQLLHEERGWDPEKPLLELAGELTKESSIRPMELLSELDADTVLALIDRLRKEVAAFREQVRALGNEALKLLEEASVAVDEMAYGKSGIHGWFRKLAAFDGELDQPGTNTRKPIETGKWHAAKASPGTIAALDTLSPRLTELFHMSVALRERGLGTYILRRAVVRDLVTAYTLHELALRLEEVKRTDGVVFFSDLTRKVAAVVAEEPVSFIHERMGARYRHYLIDEFQDTSLLQWNTLLPLIEEALGTGGSALLVGDAKQAIYRWRNGEVRLFQRFPALFGSDPHHPRTSQRAAVLAAHFHRPEPLAHNHRSGRTVVEFNNALFGALKALLSDDLRSVFDDHAQIPWRPEPGLVQLRRMERLMGEEATAKRDASLLEWVQQALDDGFRPGEIAVLVRSATESHRMAHTLVRAGHAVVSPNGLQLAGDPVVELLIDLLRFIHDRHAIAAARVMQWQAMIADAGPVDPFMTGPDDPVAHMDRFLAAHGKPTLHTTLTDLLTQLALAHGIHPAGDARLLTLLDEAHAFSTMHGQDIGGFLEHWDRTGRTRSLEPPENDDAVQVMTIHKAKGLQFPVVIVPNATLRTGAVHGERLWVRPGDAVPELPVAMVRTGKAINSIGLPEVTAETNARQLDDLDLLYVAFTRAAQRLHALVPEGGGSMGDALLRYMAEAGTPEELLWGQRAAPWPRRAATTARFIDAVEPAADPISRYIRHEAPAEWDPADPDPYRRYGNAVHAAMARVDTVHDLIPAMEEAVAVGGIDAAAAETLIRRLRPLLGSPALAPWFGDGLQVRTEATLITADGHTLRPDRVVMDGGHMRVLDIKTGHRSPVHHQQVQAYMQQLAALGHPHIEGALLYLPEGILEPVAP